MWICLCNAVTDKEIGQAAQEGVPWRTLCKKTGLASDCGSCVHSARHIYKAAEQESAERESDSNDESQDNARLGRTSRFSRGVSAIVRRFHR